MNITDRCAMARTAITRVKVRLSHDSPLHASLNSAYRNCSADASPGERQRAMMLLVETFAFCSDSEVAGIPKFKELRGELRAAIYTLTV